jgi:hypothetical protein
MSVSLVKGVTGIFFYSNDTILLEKGEGKNKGAGKRRLTG